MSSQFKRWYDHDPALLEVINLLKNYQDELKVHAEEFLQIVEKKVSRDSIEAFYEMVKPINGNRWYDKDPVISKTVELLRVVPPDIQKIAAENFLQALKTQGVIPFEQAKEA